VAIRVGAPALVEHLAQWAQYHLLGWPLKAASGLISPLNAEIVRIHARSRSDLAKILAPEKTLQKPYKNFNFYLHSGRRIRRQRLKCGQTGTPQSLPILSKGDHDMSQISQQKAGGVGSLSSGQLSAEQAAAYWKANVTIIGTLLSIWFVISFVTSYLLADVLKNIYLGSVPLGFWMAHQGGILVYIILIFTYAKLMDNLDTKYGVRG
jgi:putative solute:sodium symporter small subunit